VIGLYGATRASLVGPRPATPPVIIQKDVADTVGRDSVSSDSGMARISIDEVAAALDSVLA
jgi:hypothetical protein